MYEFHYKYMKRKYDDKLLFKDTDSLIYEFKIEEGIYVICYKDKDLVGFIDYPEDSKFFDPVNKK